MVWVLERLPALLAAELALLRGKGSGRPLQGLGQACVPARQPLGLLEEWHESHEYTE